jgi:hypothetical protein
MSQVRSKYSTIEGKDCLMIDSWNESTSAGKEETNNRTILIQHPPSRDLGLAFYFPYFKAQKAKPQTSQSVTAASTHRTKPRHQKENPSKKKTPVSNSFSSKSLTESADDDKRDLYHERQSIRFFTPWHLGFLST